jgi:mRNA interferase RelE/StbE
VVPADAAEYLEALQDAADVIAARRALAEQAPSVPAEQVWAELWRIRVGDFRVIHTIIDEALVVIVVRVANRREVCRGG